MIEAGSSSSVGNRRPEVAGEEEINVATTIFTVTGMTCAHCVGSVSSEIKQIPGVTEVQVDLASGEVTVTSDQPVDEAAVAVAVDEAGYELAR